MNEHGRTSGMPATTQCRRRRPAANLRACGLLLMVLAAVLAGCSRSTSVNSAAAAGPAGLDRFYTQKLAWSSCAQIFQCASLVVPLDYRNPTGYTIELAVIRATATD